MSVTFDITLEDFKKATKEFIESSPNCDRESLENGKKAIGLMYLGVMGNDALTDAMAPGVLQLALSYYTTRDMQLMREGK